MRKDTEVIPLKCIYSQNAKKNKIICLKINLFDTMILGSLVLKSHGQNFNYFFMKNVQGVLMVSEIMYFLCQKIDTR